MDVSGYSVFFALSGTLFLFTLRLFFLIFMLKETKGKTAKDIDYMYSLLQPDSLLDNTSLQEQGGK
jgi:hypothetical protein